MSTHAQVMKAYREDQKRPYYSLQKGKPKSRLQLAPARLYVSNPKWRWGHFQAAIGRAWRAMRTA